MEPPWSGVFTAVVHLAAAVARRGHRVELWQLHHWDSDLYEEHRELLRGSGVEMMAVATDRPLWLAGRAAAALAHERDVDGVHLHGAFNPSNTAIAWALRRPYAFSPHSGYDPVSLRRSRLRKRLYRLLFERRMLDRAALLVALTENERVQLRAYGASRPIAVIPNGVTPPTGSLDPSAFRRDLRIPFGRRLAVFVGRLDTYRKGLDRVVRGIVEAPTWHVALVGPEVRDVDWLRELIARLAIGERVHFTGPRLGSGLHQALAAGDVFILLSRWEGLPLALLEALSIGRPAIVSAEVERVVGVEAAGAGWVSDATSLGSLLRRLDGEGSADLRLHGDAAVRLARRFDWDAIAQMYEPWYERMRRRVTPGQG